MSDNQKEGNIENLDREEALKTLKENCQNFLKVSQDEKSEGIKINYLLGLIKLSDNLKIDSETFVTTIFNEILFKDLSILKNRNILSNFISSIESKQKPELFEKNFFSLLQLFGNDYNTNSIFFHQYLIDISLYYIFNSSFKCPEKSYYISFIIENDIKPFETQLLKNIINKNKKLIDENENKIIMIKCLYKKFITMNKYKSCLIIFSKMLENVNNNYKKIPKEIIYELIENTNNIGFNHVIKKTKEINDFLIFNCLLLDNLDEKLFVSEDELNMLDIYLINILNLLSLKKDLNIDIFQKIFSYYNTQKYKNLNKVFPDVLYYLSTYSYFDTQYEFLFNCLNSTNMNPIYTKLISNHLLSLNKKPINYKENPVNKYKSIKFSIIEDNINSNCLLDENLLLFDNNNNSNNNISFLNHLNLYSYIINSSFQIIKTYGRIAINFYPKILNRILILLNNLSLENSNKKFFEELLLLILDLFTIIINFYLSINEFIMKDDYLITSFLKLIEKSSLDNKYLIIYPSLINIIKLFLINSYDHFTDNSTGDNKIYNSIYDYLTTNFSNINNNYDNYQQIILIFKSLVVLYTEKNNTKLQKKFFSLDKIIDLVLKCNNDDVKLFESFYKLCIELQKSSDEFNKQISNYALNKYSKNVNNYLSESFCDYIMEKFKGMFIQKRPNNIVYDENAYFVINTISNIYNNDKIENKNKLDYINETINDFCERKLIIGVIDYLFQSIERNECDIINVINNNNDIYSEYNKLNETLNNLDYYIYIYNTYFDNNIQNNKNSMCHYGILKSLAHLLSGYLSNCIYSLLNESQGSEDNAKDIKNNKEEKIVYFLDYIKNKVLLNITLQNTSYPVVFINNVFKDKNILHYFIVHYTNYTVNKMVKDKSISIEIFIIQDIKEKNMAIINYIRQNPYFVLFMKDIINSFIEFDSLMLNPTKNYLNNNKNQINYKNENIINKLLAHGDKILSECDDNQKSMINSFFTKMLLDEIFEINNNKLQLENTQVIFLFLLDNSFLEKYFDMYGYFINIDYTLVQLYSIIRKKNVSEELNEKYIRFINKYIEIDKFNNYVMRILNNKKTFDNLFKCKNINNNYIIDLYKIIENVMNNLSNNINEKSDTGILKSKIINIFNAILQHVDNLYTVNNNFGNIELYLCGKVIKTVIKNLNNLINQINKNPNNSVDNNSNVIEQINIILEDIYTVILPKYINSFYSRISTLFENSKDKKINLDYTLDNICLSFYTIIEIISGNENNKKLTDILSNKLKPDINNFFLNLTLFNKFNDYPININNFSKSFIEAYKNDNSTEKTIYKKFLEYLYLFALLRGKLDEKNLKSVIIDLLELKEDYIQFKNLTCYFLSSIKKDITGNKFNNNTSMNFGDFSIISSIGERFKEDDKKKNTNQLNFNK